ncbi:MAG: amidohydrolase family protein [Cyclobacteriaceae bacterium]
MINNPQGVVNGKKTGPTISGFVDLQVNGYKGISFSDLALTEERFVFACKELIQRGTVAFLPTIITASQDIYKKNLMLIAKAMRRDDLKNHILGIHVEGPFISLVDGARGAHNTAWVRKPDRAFLGKLQKWADGNIKLLTMAAELEGADELCRYGVDLGMTVSLGHQMASEADLQRLVTSGARALTHLGNGLPKDLPRHENPLWAGIANDDLVAMVIADGHHVPAGILKTMIRAKGIDKVIVVSDAAPIADLPPGRYNTLGNDVVLDASGIVYNPDTGYFVGSASTMLDCMNFLASLQLLTLEELLQLGFYNPLQLLGVDPASIITPSSLRYEAHEKRFLPI